MLLMLLLPPPSSNIPSVMSSLVLILSILLITMSILKQMTNVSAVATDVVTFGFTRRMPPLCMAVSRQVRSQKGFGKSQNKPPVASDKEVKSIYSLPALYDLAFGYRNFEEEVDFLMEQHYQLTGNDPKRILELGAGPARHCMFAINAEESPIEAAMAIDTSLDMIQYSQEVAQHELPVNKADRFTYKQGDMRTFELDHGEKLYDSAWILLGSLQHLTTNSDIIQCFESVHRALVSGGTLILELPHPRETFSLGECTRNGWKIPLQETDNDNDDSDEQYGELNVIWGDDGDQFDPIQQVRQFTVEMKLEGVKDQNHAKLQNVKEIVPMRLFTSQEIDALARIAGFEVAALHGALAHDVSINDGEEAFRLVAVLCKK